MTPATCPTPRQLEDLLEDRLEPAEFSRVEAHIRGCAACLARLDELALARERADLPGLTRTEFETPFPASERPSSAETEREMPAALVVGPYDILERLGRGGMGVVYRARHRLLGREVALKVLSTSAAMGPRAAARFATEIRATERLRHPGIVRVFDAGVWEPVPGHSPVPYAALELVDGPSLKDVLKEVGPFAPCVAAEHVEGLARAVQHAHDKGVLHRDLKPANVLLSGAGSQAPGGGEGTSTAPTPDPRLPTPVLKITDFGLAKLLDENRGLTGSRDLLGTPEYMAPEIGLQGSVVDGRADVYSLGVILFECLTGRVPFLGRSAVQTLVLAQSGTPPAPSSVRSDVPAALDAIVLKCLARDPSDRYATASELAAALKSFRRTSGSKCVVRRAVSRRAIFHALLTLAGVGLALVLGRSSSEQKPVQPEAAPVAAAVEVEVAPMPHEPPAWGAKQRLSWRTGVNDYAGNRNVELRSTKEERANTRNFSDQDGVVARGPGEREYETRVLVRFDGIVGTCPSQIPPGSRVTSATLSLSVRDRNRQVWYGRVRTPWEPRSVTWESFRSAEVAEGTVGRDGGIPKLLDVTRDVQQWVNGEANHGWLMKSPSTIRIQWATERSEPASKRPLLTVEFTPPAK